MLFFEYMREVLNIRLNCQNNNKCPVDDVVHLYGACNIDFKKHYKEIHNIKLQPYLAEHVLTNNYVINMFWNRIVLEMIDMFEFLLCNPLLVKTHAQVVDHIIIKVVNQYISTMVLAVKKSIHKINQNSVMLIKRQLFDHIYLYIHSVSLITQSPTLSIEPFYNSNLVDTRYEIPPQIKGMIESNQSDVLTEFQSITYGTSPYCKLLSIKSTIDIINQLYNKIHLVCTTDGLIASLSIIIYNTKVPFILNELKFIKNFSNHVFKIDSEHHGVPLYNGLPCQEQSNIGKLYFCYTTFEATLVDILLQF